MSDRILSPPRHLSRRSKAFWRAIVGDYDLSPHHVELLRRLCEAMDRADQARELLDAEGLTVTDRYGQVKPHPAATIETQNRIAVARLVRELDLEGEPLPDPRMPRRR
jgi:P27 family predicted phage terminase small subunit